MQGSVAVTHKPHAMWAIAAIVMLGATTACSSGSGKTATPPPTASSTPSAGSSSAEHLLAGSLAAAAAQKWVHMDVSTSVADHVISFSDDDGPTTGIQRITIKGGGQGTVRVVGATTFFKANETALRGYFALPAVSARAGAGKWIRLVKGDAGYDNVTTGVLLASALGELDMKPPLQLLPHTVREGRSVIGVQGTASGADAPPGATVVLWIDDGATPLPVEYDATAPGAGSMRAVLSRWGQAVAVAPPASSVPIAALSG